MLNRESNRYTTCALWKQMRECETMSLSLGDLNKNRRTKTRSEISDRPMPRSQTTRPWSDENLNEGVSGHLKHSSKRRSQPDAVLNVEWMDHHEAALACFRTLTMPLILRLYKALTAFESRTQEIVGERARYLRGFLSHDSV